MYAEKMQLSCIDARSDIKANHKLKACVTYAEAKAAKETSESDTRKAGRYTSEDSHRAIFPQEKPAPKKVEEFDKGVQRYMKKKHARR